MADSQIDLLHCFDTHAHLTDSPQTLELIDDISTGKVALMGTREDDWGIVEQTGKKYGDKCIFGFGIHPWFAHKVSLEWRDRLKLLLQSHPKAFVGEIGLDRVATHPQSKQKYDFDKQVEIFKYQFQLAADLQRPVSLHCVHAHGWIMEFFQSIDKEPSKWPPLIGMCVINSRQRNSAHPKAVFHSYSGSVEVLKQLLKLPKNSKRFYFSYSIVVNSRSPKCGERILATPGDRLLIESDIHSADHVDGYIKDIVNLVASVKGWNIDETVERCWKNSCSFFSTE
ncbi:TatD family [Paraphysoderma sedebokerense]|nr:TatD family [Paraphysoderma sedebokerense]